MFAPVSALIGLVPLVAALPTADLTTRAASAYSIPGGFLSSARQAAIAVKQTTFQYGPAADGAGPYSPIGVLGDAYVTADTAITDASALQQVSLVTLNDSTVAQADSAQYNGLKTLQDYVSLYDRQWEPSSRPTGIDSGLLTTYTQDLLFSMERLAFDPYAVRRLSPSVDALPFTLADDLTESIAGQTVQQLFQSGRLFYVDHRIQAQLERNDKYAAACDAYFYISPQSGEFLPLAIRTNVGSNLVYTPKDAANDWLLAKIMFNVNDILFGQFYHLPATHYVTEIVYEAAIRTLSDDHPVLAIISRLLYGEFGVRPLAEQILFPSGGDIDANFAFTGAAAQNLSNILYQNGQAGGFQRNYFQTNLERRGLVNSAIGPALKHFPFQEDAAPINAAISTFMTAFVNSYYANDAAVANDIELQAWVIEANGPAKVIDFPATIQSRSTLIAVLTHMGHLVSAAHHAVNLNQLLTGSAVLPFHPTALYQPIPTSKGVADVAAFLPPLDKSLHFIDVSANFARPLLAGTNRTLVHMFDDRVMLARMNPAVQQANAVFKATMQARSQVVKARAFDANGLSQGMPFIWQALDPDVVPWSATV